MGQDRADASLGQAMLAQDRDRIARDLHDHVISQLFAIGLRLEELAITIGPEHDAEAKLHSRVDEIDRTIRQIRTSIFELRGPIFGPPDGLRSDVLAVTAELAPILGFSASVSFSGQLDSAVLGALADDVLACIREAVTNVSRHARARHVDITLAASEDEVCLLVVDDGVGIDPDGKRSGLDNLRARAAVRGGTFATRSPATGGTELHWKAPIS